MRLATGFAVVAAVLTLANIVVSIFNKGIEQRVALTHSRNQADQALISQTQDEGGRVRQYLRNAVLRLDRAAAEDPAFAAALRKHDPNRVFLQLQEELREARGTSPPESQPSTSP